MEVASADRGTSWTERDLIGALRIEAIRGALYVAVLSLVTNIGMLAIPLFNMQVFNRVMTTHNLRTLAGLSIGAAIGAVIYVVVDRLRLSLLAVLGDRFAGRVAVPLLRSCSSAAAQDS